MQYLYPPPIPVDQHFERRRLDDIGSAIADQLGRIPDGGNVGKSIAVTVGSRSIMRPVEIICKMVAPLRSAGGFPFIVPSMGSHGGATAEGQIAVLKGYGITEESTGAEIRSLMEVVEIDRLADGTPLYTDRIASNADAIVITNELKPHANFKAGV